MGILMFHIPFAEYSSHNFLKQYQNGEFHLTVYLLIIIVIVRFESMRQALKGINSLQCLNKTLEMRVILRPVNDEESSRPLIITTPTVLESSWQCKSPCDFYLRNDDVTGDVTDAGMRPIRESGWWTHRSTFTSIQEFPNILIFYPYTTYFHRHQ